MRNSAALPQKVLKTSGAKDFNERAQNDPMFHPSFKSHNGGDLTVSISSVDMEEAFNNRG